MGNDSVLLELPIECLERNPFQPRIRFDEAELAGLAESLKVTTLIEPIVARRHPVKKESYQIAAGERRWRAAGIAQFPTVLVNVREIDDRAMARISIVENVQRSDLTPIEEARAYSRLIEEFGYTGDEIANEVSKSKSHISHTLSLLKLDERVQEYILQGLLKMGHGKVLTGVGQMNQVGLAKKALKGGWSVRQLESAAKALSATREPVPIKRDPDIARLEMKLTEILGSPLSLKKKGRGWLVNIECSSLDELEGVLEHIK